MKNARMASKASLSKRFRSWFGPLDPCRVLAQFGEVTLSIVRRRKDTDRLVSILFVLPVYDLQRSTAEFGIWPVQVAADAGHSIVVGLEFATQHRRVATIGDVGQDNIAT